VRFVPVTDKTNPGGLLFSPTASHPRKAEFQDITALAGFPNQVAALAVNNINTFGMLVDNKFNSAQSNAQFNENHYINQFTTTASVLRSNIQTKLSQAGIPLTPDHIVRRAMAQSCAGCHELNNNAPNNDLGNGMIWPRSLTFVHVSELTGHKDTGPDGARFGISPALISTFLPHRKAVIENFLNTPAPVCGPSQNSWQGCGETGCTVCASAIANFPCYFDNNPGCEPANMCYGQLTTCNSACPAPTSADACVSSGYCGDGTCNSNEDSISCPTDCGGGGGGFCGDGFCNLNTEDSFMCPEDCGGGFCGDGICQFRELCRSDCGRTCVAARESGDLQAMRETCPVEPVLQ
jgi:hypothetical protein